MVFFGSAYEKGGKRFIFPKAPKVIKKWTIKELQGIIKKYKLKVKELL